MIAHDVMQRVIRAYFEKVCALDAAGCAQVFAADARMYNPPGAPPTEGREAIRQALDLLFGACQRLTAAPVQTFINGNGAAVLYRGELTAKAGATVPFEGIDVFEVDATGHIQEIRYYSDPGPVMAALRGLTARCSERVATPRHCVVGPLAWPAAASAAQMQLGGQPASAAARQRRADGQT